MKTSNLHFECVWFTVYQFYIYKAVFKVLSNDISEMAEKEHPKRLLSIKAVGTWTKLGRANFVRALEINQTLEMRNVYSREAAESW